MALLEFSLRPHLINVQCTLVTRTQWSAPELMLTFTMLDTGALAAYCPGLQNFANKERLEVTERLIKLRPATAAVVEVLPSLECQSEKCEVRNVNTCYVLNVSTLG